MTKASRPKRRTPSWLAWPAVVAAAAAVLAAAWQAAFFVLGAVAGDYVGETEGLVRLSAAAGAIAMAITLAVTPLLLRAARASIVVAIPMIPLGVYGTYALLPRVFVHTVF